LPFDSLRSLRAFSLSVARHERVSDSPFGEAEVSRMAEREGFEPSVEFPLHTLSKRAP